MPPVWRDKARGTMPCGADVSVLINCKAMWGGTVEPQVVKESGKAVVDETHVPLGMVTGIQESSGSMASDYAEAWKAVVARQVQGVLIPFVTPRLLWRMKAVTHRAKDTPDLLFLRQWFEARGETPPQV